MSDKPNNEFRDTFDPWKSDISLCDMDDCLADLDASMRQYDAVLINLKRIRAFLVLQHHTGFMLKSVKAAQSDLLNTISVIAKIRSCLQESIGYIQRQRELRVGVEFIDDPVLSSLSSSESLNANNHDHPSTF